MMTAPACQNCGATLTRTLVDLGMQPLSNSYVAPERSGVPDKTYPLHARCATHVFLCKSTG